MLNKEACVISGIGVASSIGCNIPTVWNAVLKGKSNLTHYQLFPSSLKKQLVGKISDESLDHNLEIRQLKKIDKFTILSIAATKQCLNSAKFILNDENRNTIGFLLGNDFGGWSYVEEQMYDLYRGDMSTVNPYVATAWFPAASQGEVSILNGIGGYSKTFSSENLSAGFAFQHALDLIKEDYLDTVLVGGSEAPLTTLVYNACLNSRAINKRISNIPIGEGAAIFSIEKAIHASKRGINSLVNLVDVGFSYELETAINTCLSNANKEIKDIDCIVLNACGDMSQDKNELEWLQKVFKDSPKKIYLCAFKNLYGNTMGASMALELAISCIMLKEQVVPPFANPSDNIDEEIFTISDKPITATLKNILVSGIDSYGQCCCLLVSTGI